MGKMKFMNVSSEKGDGESDVFILMNIIFYFNIISWNRI